MSQPAVTPEVAVGACLTCRAVFLVTPATPNCLLCGGPPAYILPFSAPLPEPAQEEILSPLAAAEPEEVLPEEEGQLIYDLHLAIERYLLEGLPEEQFVHLAFLSAGAEVEQATVAVGRLSAVRDLITQLRSAREPAPPAPSPPPAPPEEPQSEPLPAAPPPPEQEEDRTNPGPRYLPF